jgi:hypothetical protein
VQVRGVDLDKGHAIRVDGQAYCAKCAPEVRASLPPPPPRSSTSRIPVVTKSSSGHRKAVAAPTPHPVRKADRRPLMAGAAAGGAILLIVVLALSFRGGEAPKKVVEPAPVPAPAPKAKPVERPDTAAILGELEALFAANDQFGFFGRLQTAKPLLRGSPQETRAAELEARMSQGKDLKVRERQAEMGLAQVRSIRASDRRFQQKAEVIRLLESTIKLGVASSAEAQKMLEEYRREADEAAARLLDITGWYRFVSADRLGKDDSGKGNDATGLEGATWNGSRGVRFQGNGAIVIPSSIRADYTIALTLKTQQKHAGGDQWWKGVGLVDGEMSGIVEDFGTSLLAGKFAAGVGKPDLTVASKTDINDGRWHHVAATRDGKSGELKIYVDGAAEGGASAPRGPRKETTRLTIGTLQTGDGRFAGEIDDVRLFTRVLGADEIRELAKR